LAEGLEYVGTAFIDSCSIRARTASSTNADKSPFRPALAKYRRTRRSRSSDMVKVQRVDCFMTPPQGLSRPVYGVSPSNFYSLISYFSFTFNSLI
jgi:hypothetical protein